MNTFFHITKAFELMTYNVNNVIGSYRLLFLALRSL